MNLALSNLFQDKLRFVLSVIGIALAVMLILFLLGLRAGVFRSAVIYLDNAPGSAAVMPQGVKSTSAGSGQFLPPETVSAIASKPGVGRAAPVLLMMAIPELHGKKQVIKLVGYDPALGGGPWSLKAANRLAPRRLSLTGCWPAGAASTWVIRLRLLGVSLPWLACPTPGQADKPIASVRPGCVPYL